MALKEHCFHCFDVVLSELERDDSNGNNSKNCKYEFDYLKSFPLFVSWHKSGNGNLRGKESLKHDLLCIGFFIFSSFSRKNLQIGCVGTFSPKPILDGLTEYAKISAFQDRRFRPISREELPSLSCTVSLLTDFEEMQDLFDWSIGQHGIKIGLKHLDSGTLYSATFLPEVAQEQQWTQQETISALLRKAGIPGSKIKSLVKRNSLNLQEEFTISCSTRYQSSISHVSYQDFSSLRK